MNPDYWPTWERHIQPEKNSFVWFEIGRRIPKEIHSALPIVVLGTSGMGLLAIGETVSAVEFRTDPDWVEAAPLEQAEGKEPRNRVRIRMQGLAVPIPIEDIEANPTVARLSKAAREAITWLKSDEYAALISLVQSKKANSALSTHSTKKSEALDPLVARLKTPEDCEQFAKNVQTSRSDLAKQARRRALDLRTKR
jgi:hypothetical protein